MASAQDALNIADLMEFARRRLPTGLFQFIDRGAEDEVTLRENRDSIKRILIRQRVGVDVAQPDFSTTLFGVKQTMPVGIAATGLASMINLDGERKLARAAAAAGVPYTIGTSNFTAQADLKEICGDLLWRLIYPNKRREITEHHLRMSEEVGVSTVVLTMDSPVVGNREYLKKAGFQLQGVNAQNMIQTLASPRWLFGTALRYMLNGGFPEIADMPEGERRWWKGTHSWAYTADDFTWEEVKAIRRRWKGNLVVKGLSTAEDAKLAAEAGVDGIIVSNHGGRSLDGCVASMKALPEIVDAVAPRVMVMVDGGFTRSADILKAIAIGASSVWVGRATLFGLAAFGQPGAERALAIFREEFKRAMALTGSRTLADLGRANLDMSAL